jgi:hypothetical protein
MKHPLVSRRHDCPARFNKPRPEPAAPARKEKRQKEGSGIAIVTAVREYLADILGAFMPGVYFSIHLLISTVLFLFMVNGLEWENVETVISGAAPVLELAGPFAVFGFCLFSYIIRFGILPQGHKRTGHRQRDTDLSEIQQG